MFNNLKMYSKKLSETTGMLKKSVFNNLESLQQETAGTNTNTRISTNHLSSNSVVKVNFEDLKMGP
jgi:hypothetical protein